MRTMSNGELRMTNNKVRSQHPSPRPRLEYLASGIWNLVSSLSFLRLPLCPAFLTLSLYLFISSPLSASVWTFSGPDTTFGIDRELVNVTVSPDGIITLAPALTERASLDESSVWDIASFSGKAFLGTGNNGRVYRLVGGKPELAFEGSGEVLALAADAAGVYFGTTPDGFIYSIGATGEAVKKAETGESYVFALLAGSSGELYCATGTNGKLLRIGRSGQCDTVFTASQAHVTSLAWLSPGKEMLAGTSPEGLVYRLTFAPGRDRPQVSVLYDTPLDEVRAIAVAGPLVYVAANPGADAETGPTVYCLEQDGILKWQWSLPDSSIYDVLPDKSGLLVATGDNGLLFRLDSLGRGSLIQNAEPARLLSLARDGNRILCGTGTPARVFELTSAYADTGVYVSPVQDCSSPARFGRIERRGSAPNGTSVALDTRTGNSETPDSTWNQWQPASGEVKSPPARFIQWRARLGTRFPTITPSIERVDVYYQVPNRAPKVKKLALAHIELPDAAKGSAQPTRELSWEVEDPDGDTVNFELFYRREGTDRWLKLSRDLTGSSLQLDTRTLPDGWCTFRIVASDKLSRPAGTALATDYVSAPTLIDNTPPEVQAEVTGSTLRATASDKVSAIAACRYSLNGGPWLPLGPSDGLFDSPTEQCNTEVKLESGSNALSVWAADALGNTTTSPLTISR